MSISGNVAEKSRAEAESVSQDFDWQVFWTRVTLEAVFECYAEEQWGTQDSIWQGMKDRNREHLMYFTYICNRILHAHSA